MLHFIIRPQAAITNAFADAAEAGTAAARPSDCNCTHSTVAKGRCRWVFSPTDLTFNFTITYRSPALTGSYYSDYQLFLYQTISEHREKGMTFDAIAEWLNEKRYLTVRGRRFRGAHVHSILKKRLAKEDLLNREHPPVRSDFSIEVIDKTILMSDFGF